MTFIYTDYKSKRLDKDSETMTGLFLNPFDNKFYRFDAKLYGSALSMYMRADITIYDIIETCLRGGKEHSIELITDAKLIKKFKGLVPDELINPWLRNEKIDKIL